MKLAVTRPATLPPRPARATLYSLPIAVVATLFALACAPAGTIPGDAVTTINAEYLVTSEEAHEWALVKDASIPTLTGSPGWNDFMAFMEEKLVGYGVVDVTRNSWTFDRWHTSDDPTDWSLVSDGKPVKVAFYGAYSGSTGPEGVTASLVYYDHDDPPASIEGKIVVVPTRPQQEPPLPANYVRTDTFNDHEYRTNDESFPPLYEFVDPSATFTFDIYYQMRQGLWRIGAEGGAAGAVIVYDMSFARTAGMYSFGVPTLHDAPTVTLDRVEGAKVIADAKAGKSATLRLEATVEPAEAYQLISYLPGRDYGTDADEQIMLVTHTDGPSITQDNGALGLLAIVKYYSHIPQEQRRRTLTVMLDCRHYMPGAERAFAEQHWWERYPERRDKIVAMVQAEHLGEMEYREEGEEVIATGLAEHSFIWTRNNPVLIDEAIRAVKQYPWSKMQVSAPERPGVHGGQQAYWWGVGSFAQGDRGNGRGGWDLPAYGFGGNLGFFWSTRSRIDIWSKEVFTAQASALTQLTGVLMSRELDEIRSHGRSDTRE